MFLREKRPARRSRYLYVGGGHLTDELECCYVRVRVQGDVITYPLPDVALPLPPRPIDTFVECTSVTNIFPSTRKYLNLWFRRQRIHGFPLAQFLLQAEQLSLSTKGRKRGAYLSRL
ncbi:hypothetical protein EV363DRAFT_1156429 [Boletus edulis]|nr:hypothetical protein EV363DRAFT_1156429 [Boletus edulis]